MVIPAPELAHLGFIHSFIYSELIYCVPTLNQGAMPNTGYSNKTPPCQYVDSQRGVSDK